MRVATAPTFARLSFGWHKPINATVTRDAERVNILFDHAAPINVNGFRSQLPAYIGEISSRVSLKGLEVFIDVTSTATIRSYGIATGLTTEISDAATSSFQPTVSGDGRYIAYVQNSEVVETRPGTSQPWWYWSATRVIRVFDVATGATVTAVAGDFDSVSPAIASAGDHIFVQQGPPEGPGPVGIYRWQRPST